VETRLPNLPNGQRVVYPLNAAGIKPSFKKLMFQLNMLRCSCAFTIDACEQLRPGSSHMWRLAYIVCLLQLVDCSFINDPRDSSDQIQSGDLDAHHDYASAQCSRMVLDATGIAGGWKVEYMPEPRGKRVVLWVPRTVHSAPNKQLCLMG
jgi:hypothetical protein